MSRLPYEAATSIVDATGDIVLSSSDNSFIDPWNMIPNYGG